MSATDDEIVRGVLEREDHSPARFKNWKRDLLDLTLRNPLLNLPRTQKVLELLVPGGMLPMLDDVVHSGRSVRVSAGVDSSDLERLTGIRTANDVPPAQLTGLFTTTRTVYSSLADERHRRQLRAMKREADTLEQETGSNYLYLTLGALVHQKADGTEARAPLFLLPVRLTGGLAFTPYAITLDGEEIAQPNQCLLQWLVTTTGLELTELGRPAVDDSGLAIGAVIAGIRRQLAESELPYRIEETAAIAILRFSTFQIWKDLEENWEPLMRNPVVRHLVERPGETFDDAAGSGDIRVEETELRLPIAADGSQLSAVVRGARGRSFVLEGPPGTGKSQTITNLIAHALTEGKTVLFVAEKQAALEVVKRRLDSIGLGTFGLELHGAKQSMNSIREQLRRSLDLRVSVDQPAWDATDARLRAAIVHLESYPQLVHEKNATGHSLWSAYDASASLGDGPTARIPLAFTRSTTTVDVVRTTRDYSDAAVRFAIRPGHHWLVSGTADASTLDPETVRAALAGLTEARRSVAGLGAAWLDALREVRPAGGLPAVVRLLGARDLGRLPTTEDLSAIDRPAWRVSTDALRRDVAAYGIAHAEALGAATPAAIEHPSLDELIARSTKLDGSRFFPELRRKRLRAQIEPLLTAGTDVAAGRFTAFLTSLRAARADAAPLVATKSGQPGLLTPEPWRPYLETAEEDLATAHWIAETAVWTARNAAAAWALIPIASADESARIRDLDAAWTRWLAAIGGSYATVQHWDGELADGTFADGELGARGRGSGEQSDGGAAEPQSDDGWLDHWARSEALWQRDLDTSGVLHLQRFADIRRLLDDIRAAGLAEFSDQLASVSILPADAPEALLRGLAMASLKERGHNGNLDSFDGDAHDRAASAYLEHGALARVHARSALAAKLIENRPFDADNLRGEVAELKRQLERKRGGLAFREVARRYPRALTSIAPCFLMSPGSVAHFLDADSITFDLVIFDEASQIRVPQAIGAMGRGTSVIVVGDSKQMPPTRIMQVDATSEVDTSAEHLVVEDLESILTEAVESGLPQLWLNWHYRSQDESLIAFSNSTYYDNKLVSLPSPRVADDTGLSWRRVDGVFDRGRTRTNQIEAAAIVDEITALLSDPETRDESIGVVCFNIQQRDLILNTLEDSADVLIQRALTAEPGRELFVKNLENVQGDERDIILFSLAFSVDRASGILPLNFGPLNLTGGERRLNVAVTRARKRIVLFSSFDASDIDPARSNARGISDLRSYLEFASTRRLPAGGVQDAAASNRGRFVDEVAAAIRADGFEVDTEFGLSSFKVDLAVRMPGAEAWRVAVMVDGPGWASRPTVSDRDGSPRLLVDLMGWPTVVRVWLPGWIRDRGGVLERIRDAMRHPIVERPRFIEVTAPNRMPPNHMPPGRLPVPEAIASRTLDLPVFEVADDSAIASQAALTNMRMARPAIERIASGALATEGPVQLDRLVATVARRFGYSRIGEAKRDDLAAIIADAFATIDGFVWPDDLDPATWRGVRRSESSADRAITEISPQEAVNAMELVLREAFSMTRDELLKDTSAVLGYGRLTDQARAWLGVAVSSALERGRIRASGDRLSLP